MQPGLSSEVTKVLGVANALKAFRSEGSTAPGEVQRQTDIMANSLAGHPRLAATRSEDRFMNDASQPPREVVIPRSKKKVGVIIAGCLAFCGASTWLWTIADDQPLFNFLKLRVVAVLGWAFFGFGFYVGCRSFLDQTPGLILNSDGIVDNSSAVAVGCISWEEVTGFRIGSINAQKFLTIEVADPQKYVDRGNFLQRKLKAANMAMVGSPISISANTLKIEFEEFVRLFAEFYERFKREHLENLP